MGHRVIDFSNIVEAFTTEKIARLKLAPEWSGEHAASSLSVVTGGQWTQSHRYSINR